MRARATFAAAEPGLENYILVDPRSKTAARQMLFKSGHIWSNHKELGIYCPVA